MSRYIEKPKIVTPAAPEAKKMLTLSRDPRILGRRVMNLHSSFTKRVIDPGNRKRSDYNYGKALHRLGHELEHHVFAHSKGSDPLPYSSPEDLLFYTKLKEQADKHRDAQGNLQPWPRATIITHEETTRLRTRPWLTKDRRKDPIVRDESGTPIVGYRVGYLNAGPYETSVLFCSDGLLRMAIGYPSGHLHGQTYAGFSGLPEPDVMYPAITSGYNYAVSFKLGQSNTLRSDVQKISGLDINIGIGQSELSPGALVTNYSPHRDYTSQ